VSGWRIAVASLAAAGGGPLQSHKIDAARDDLQRAKELGLVWCINRTHWQLTRTGRALAEGRVAAVVSYAEPGGGQGRRGTRLIATWLAALPPRNSIRLDPAAVVWSYRNAPATEGA
jgi:hypothetical protein